MSDMSGNEARACLRRLGVGTVCRDGCLSIGQRRLAVGGSINFVSIVCKQLESGSQWL